MTHRSKITPGRIGRKSRKKKIKVEEAKDSMAGPAGVAKPRQEGLVN